MIGRNTEQIREWTMALPEVVEQQCPTARRDHPCSSL